MKKLIITLLLPILICGCTPWQGATTEPEKVSPVYTDWSKLTDYEAAKSEYSLHAGYNASGTLTARSDYGQLLSYAGTYSALEKYITDRVPLFGLVTSKGELVTDPIYSQISFQKGFLILSRGIPKEASDEDAAMDIYSSGKMLVTIAAADGSWVHEIEDSSLLAIEEEVMMTATNDNSIEVWNKKGEKIARFDFSLFEKSLGKDFQFAGDLGNGIEWLDEKVGYLRSNYYNGKFHEKPIIFYLDFESGEVMRKPPKGYPAEIDYDSLVQEEEDGSTFINGNRVVGEIIDEITGEKYYRAFLTDTDDGDSYYALYDSDGNEIIDKYNYEDYFTLPTVRAGLCSVVENGTFFLRRISDGKTIFRYVVNTNSD